jgi:hypothetical protein
MKKCLLISILTLLPTLGLAHADHAPKVAACSKDCTKAEIEASVPTAVELLIKKAKLEGTWTTAKIEKVEQKQFKKASEWVATLFDEKQKDTSKQRLYIFITTKGYLNGSNFTAE